MRLRLILMVSHDFSISAHNKRLAILNWIVPRDSHPASSFEWRSKVSDSSQLEGGEFTVLGRGPRLYFCTWSRELTAWWKAPCKRSINSGPVIVWQIEKEIVLLFLGGGDLRAKRGEIEMESVCVCIQLCACHFRRRFLLAASLPADLSGLVSLCGCEMAHCGVHFSGHLFSFIFLLFFSLSCTLSLFPVSIFFFLDTANRLDNLPYFYLSSKGLFSAF